MTPPLYLMYSQVWRRRLSRMKMSISCMISRRFPLFLNVLSSLCFLHYPFCHLLLGYVDVLIRKMLISTGNPVPKELAFHEASKVKPGTVVQTKRRDTVIYA